MRIHTFSLPYESREVGRRYMREGGDGASSQELFLNKPVSRGSKIAEVEVRMELDRFVELFCIALKRGKVSVWHAKVHGKIVEGRGTWRKSIGKGEKKESGRRLSTNYIARSLPPSLSPLWPPPRNVSRNNVFDNISRPMETYRRSKLSESAE